MLSFKETHQGGRSFLNAGTSNPLRTDAGFFDPTLIWLEIFAISAVIIVLSPHVSKEKQNKNKTKQKIREKQVAHVSGKLLVKDMDMAWKHRYSLVF